MRVRGMEGLSPEQVSGEIRDGARFVVFQYAVSIVVLTFKRRSDIYFIRRGESAAAKGAAYTVLSLIFGWWGIPWGPIFTIGSVWVNCRGGKDVTDVVFPLLTPNYSGEIVGDFIV